MNNYPDGMDWGAYDDYHTPLLKCGHRSGDGCDCWCDGGSGEDSHMKDDCTGDNCTHFQCQSCAAPTDEEEWLVDNLQRFVPQHKELVVRLCGHCYEEYKYEREEKELRK